ncbi:hypothetical protein VMCG_03721 [Cytospora schulzeri]|uniref:Uncharacterized protein n=1 Tax=Cytospora schulzeri TaxID=448051 RepID=A0A423WV02_9PEZI|nr:hypothetical protein VMCG_03721 [Valsa malicola]
MVKKPSREKALRKSALLRYVDQSQGGHSPTPEIYHSFHCKCERRCKTTETREGKGPDGRVLWKVKWHPCTKDKARDCIKQLRGSSGGGGGSQGTSDQAGSSRDQGGTDDGLGEVGDMAGDDGEEEAERPVMGLLEYEGRGHQGGAESVSGKSPEQ